MIHLGRERTRAVEKQLGVTACEHGKNWGFDFTGIWVNGNCSAEFGVG